MAMSARDLREVPLNQAGDEKRDCDRGDDPGRAAGTRLAACEGVHRRVGPIGCRRFPLFSTRFFASSKHAFVKVRPWMAVLAVLHVPAVCMPAIVPSKHAVVEKSV